jgi:DNA-binding transcriptional ArsR family regulator
MKHYFRNMSFTSVRAQAIRDPRALRALAHPARLAILERLTSQGPATATECAGTAGLSPSACSYHLRALARWGLVTETDTTDRRERRWQAEGPFVIGDHDQPRQADVRAAEHLLTGTVIEQATQRVLTYLDRSDDEPRPWRDAATVSSRSLLMTADELTDLLEQVDALVAPYLASHRKNEAPPDARRVHLHSSAVPARP